MAGKEEKADLIVEVDDDIRICLFGRNWTSQHHREITKGKNRGSFTWFDLGFYSSFEQACDSLFRKHLDLLTGLSGREALRDVKEAVAIGAAMLQEAVGPVSQDNKRLRSRVAQLEQQLAEARSKLEKAEGS